MLTDSLADAMQHAGATDVGRWRKVNQDHWQIDPGLGLAVVADGMGGHVRGEEASRLAVDALCGALAAADDSAAKPPTADPRARERLTAAITVANRRVHEENLSAGHLEGTGMGTTLTGLWYLAEGRAIVFNIGDSRLYRERRGHFELLTEDHTLYRAWERAGRQGPAPPRNIILRAIGLHREVDAELSSIEVAPGDRFLLCSDGLSGMVPDERIAALLAADPDASPSRLCERLVEAANEAGGEDNITVVLLTPRP